MRKTIYCGITLLFILVFPAYAFADTTDTPNTTLTTVSSVKIDSDGKVLSRTPQSTTTTIKAMPEETNSDTKSNSYSTTTEASHNNSAPVNRTSDDELTTSTSELTDRDLEQQSEEESDDVVVKGEKIENPAMGAASNDKNKEATKNDDIGFDVKPYLGIAILIMLLGITGFSRPSTTVNGGSKSDIKRRMRTL